MTSAEVRVPNTRDVTEIISLYGASFLDIEEEGHDAYELDIRGLWFDCR